MKKFFALALALVLALSLTVTSADELKVIRVGATAAPHAEILESEAVTAKLAELGYKLEVVVYEGYVLENPAVADGTDDANYFQHKPYLDSYNETASESEQLVSAFTVHYEPFAIYSKKVTSLADLQDGAHIGLPNDPSNETRALLLLEAADYCDHNHFANDDIATMRAVQARTAQAKGYAAETATKVATMAVNAMGAYGVCDEYQAERFVRDAAIAPNIEGSGDIQYLIHGMYVAANGNTN